MRVVVGWANLLVRLGDDVDRNKVTRSVGFRCVQNTLCTSRPLQ